MTTIAELADFNPELHLFRDDGRTLVVFDTNLACDQKRAPRSVALKTFDSIALKIEGFDQPEDKDGATVVKGVIALDVGDGSQTLAECELVFAPSPQKGGKKRTSQTAAEPVFPVADVEYLVRQRVSDALSAALVRYGSVMETAPFATTGSVAVQAPAQGAGLLAAPPRPLVGGNRVAANGKAGWKRYAVAAAIPLVLVAGFFAVVGKKKDPLEMAVANAMAQDPKMIEAQVNLTQETLKQMGLDPGKAADLGCLAAQ
mgnify:CR=1 FL=1